ncbi:MAG: hypothetical protein FWE85_02950, partial [Clostridiales bacterium]|nr:hypothetical protein [Clostridiales bacterium]
MKKALLSAFLLVLAFLAFGCSDNQGSASIPNNYPRVVAQSMEELIVFVNGTDPDKLMELSWAVELDPVTI